MHTEEDIRLIVAQTEEIQQAEEEMLYKVFDFADKEAHDVMVPRPEVVALSVELPPQEALAAVIDSPYTRYPVYRGSLDDVIGILHVRDLFGALYDRGIENVVIEGIVRPAYVVPETKDLASLLAEFRRQNQHMALVVDEYGAVQGIVTLEDLLEEIVGEIEDEYDLPDESVERIDDRRIRIHGTFTIDDFNEQFDTRAAAGGLPHGRRLRLRRAGTGPAARRRGRARRAPLRGRRGGRAAHRAPRGRVRGARARGRGGSGGSSQHRKVGSRVMQSSIAAGERVRGEGARELSPTSSRTSFASTRSTPT